MNYNLKKIYEKTDGYCHICHKKLSLSNYGKNGEKGAWHVDHSIPRAKGGTNHMNNLFAACTSCNTSKSDKSTLSARRKNGNTRAPLSKAKKENLRTSNTITGMVVGGAIGSIIGPAGALIGSMIGGAIGENNSPKK